MKAISSAVRDMEVQWNFIDKKIGDSLENLRNALNKKGVTKGEINKLIDECNKFIETPDKLAQAAQSAQQKLVEHQNRIY